MASNLGLRSLTMSHLWDARLKWVKLSVKDILHVNNTKLKLYIVVKVVIITDLGKRQKSV